MLSLNKDHDRKTSSEDEGLGRVIELHLQWPAWPSDDGDDGDDGDDDGDDDDDDDGDDDSDG